MADGGSGGHGGARSLFAYYGTLPSLPSFGSRCDEWNLVPWLVSPTLGGGHPFENNFTCAIERGSLAPRTWSGESHWAFVLPCRRMPSRWSSSSRIERGENGSGRRRPPPVAQANVAVVSARFQSGQRHYCAHCGFAIERKSGEGRGPPGSRYSLDGGIFVLV